MADEIAIRVESVSKNFKLPLEKHNSLKSKVVHAFGKTKGFQTQHALKDVSFDIKKGEFFGIVGRNGSGKSTLLKLLAGIYQPTAGKISVSGKLVPFIELGVGFNPELTGRENVFLNGALLGFTNKQVAKMYDDIVEFAELEQFMDQKLKNYSSGMQVRLAFSMAVRADADILLIDEVLAVGDADFQRKCFDYFKKLKRDKKTVVFVSHDMEAVKKFCTKAMMLSKGELAILGSPEDVANEYSLENLTRSIASNDMQVQTNTSTLVKDFKVELLSAKYLNQNDRAHIKYTVTPMKNFKARIVMDLYNPDEGCYLYCMDSPRINFIAEKPVSINMSFDISLFNNMSVVVQSSIRDSKDYMIAFTDNSNSPRFIIRRTDYENNQPQSGVIFKDKNNAKIEK